MISRMKIFSSGWCPGPDDLVIRRGRTNPKTEATDTN